MDANQQLANLFRQHLVELIERRSDLARYGILYPNTQAALDASWEEIYGLWTEAHKAGLMPEPPDPCDVSLP